MTEPIPTTPPLGCPSWCTTDHAASDWQSRYVSEDGFTVYAERIHSCDVAVIPNPGAGVDKQVHVCLTVVDDLDSGERQPVVVNADGADCMEPATATAVAAAIVEAVRVARGGISVRHGAEKLVTDPVQRAVVALSHFGPDAGMSREQASALLTMWSHVGTLTAGQRELVVDTLSDSGDQPVPSDG
jgi:hypothetical protein